MDAGGTAAACAVRDHPGASHESHDPHESGDAGHGAKPTRSTAIRRIAVLAILLGPSLWAWRSLLGAGLTAHAPPFRTVGDVGQGIVFMSWLPYAIGHGANPFFTHMMFAPQGVNLLSNTSFFLPAFVLAPVTELFGPVASFDVAVLLGPVISGAALYFVLRRYRFGTFAALVPSVFYAYSPYMAREIPLGHFNLTWMFFPPLLLYLVDEIFGRQSMRPVTSGLALAALLIVQFFNSLEMLVETCLLALLLLVLAAATHPRQIVRRLRPAAVSAGVAIAVAVPVLAYPFWFAEFGPEHVTTFNTTVSTIEDAVTSAVWPSATPPIFGATPSLLGRIDSGFVGPVVCLLVVAACALWRNQRYRLVPYAAVGAAVSYVLTWGPYLRISSTGLTRVKGPDYWLLDVPVLRDLQEYRFAALTDLFCAFCVAVCLDWAARRLAARRSSFGRPVVAVALGTLSAVAVLAFPALGDGWHQPIQAVRLPPVLTSAAVSRIPARTVTILEPPGDIAAGAPFVWQADALVRLDETGGYAWRQINPDGLGYTEGPVTAVSELFGPGLLAQVPSPPSRVTRPMLARLRAQLRSWHVGAVILVKGSTNTGPADIRIMTEVLDARPALVDGSAVWTHVPRDLER